MERKHTVLVVDDEPDVVKSVQDLLRLDYRVLGATDAAGGAAILLREEVHVIMTDQRMPGMSGVEFLHQVRGEYPDAIRLLFTGYADIRAVIDAINQGNVYRYIVKPWDPDELQGIIREACELFDLIVDRKKLLTELLQKNKELEQANADLRHADQLKRAFMQVVSHELRTPLSVVMLLANLALRTPQLSAATSDYLLRIQHAARRLEYLIRQMDTALAAQQLDRRLDLQPTDVSALLAEVAEEVRPFLELRRQSLELKLADRLGAVLIDGVKIRDSVEQLLMNAIKFTSDQGRITLSADRPAPGGLEIRVADTGVGIAPEHLPHVFESLFTGMDPMHHSSGLYEFGSRGIGLGLSTVKAFVEMHGGRVSVASQPGRGTTFAIHLPGSEPASSAPSVKSA